MTIESGWVQVAIVCGVWIATVGVAWGRFSNRFDVFDLRMKSMEDSSQLIAQTLKDFNRADKDLALLRSEHAALAKDLATLHETVENLRKGEGFIQGPRRGNIEGEWPSRRA